MSQQHPSLDRSENRDAWHHSHTHVPKSFGLVFALGMAPNVKFVIVEAAFGLISNSTALLADAGHNLSDGLDSSWPGELPPVAISAHASICLRVGDPRGAVQCHASVDDGGSDRMEAIQRFASAERVAGR